MADSLVDQGWRTGDPIILFGNFYAFRGPLRWYLPDDPPLTLGARRDASCERVFVVSNRERPAARISRARPRVEEVHDGIMVAQVDGPVALSDRVWRGGTLLVSATSAAACIRALPERLIRRELGPARL